MSFTPEDLSNLDDFLRDIVVVPLIEAHDGKPYDVAMRHDVDHDLDKAIRFAKWEFVRGYRSTYFILHAAPYYNDWNAVITAAVHFRSMGHEVGIHHDALGQAVRELGKSANVIDLDDRACNILNEQLDRFQTAGIKIVGAAAHGSGDADNVDFIRRMTPEKFGLKYEAYLLNREGSDYISDNQGRWRSPLVHVEGRPAQVLVHPIHWPM